MLDELFPILPLLLNKWAEFFILEFGPVLFGLICDPPVTTIAHFWISARKLQSYLLKKNVGPRAKLKEQLIFLLSPGLFGLFIPLPY